MDGLRRGAGRLMRDADAAPGRYAGRVLRRLSASPWTRAGLLAIALGFACYGLVSQWPQVRAAVGQLAASTSSERSSRWSQASAA